MYVPMLMLWDLKGDKDSKQYLNWKFESFINEGFQSVVSNNGPKMALRMFYFINIPTQFQVDEMITFHRKP